MNILKLVAAISLTGLSLASCVDGGSYNSGGDVYGGGYGGVVYYGGNDGYYGGYPGRYPYGGRYDRYNGGRYNRYQDRRGDNRNDDRRGNREWNGQRPDRNTSSPRPERQPDRPAARNYNPAPYSPSSCGSLDCRGMSVSGSNR